jgi:hypothetical protein
MATYVPAEIDDAAKGTISNLVSPIGAFCDESGTDSVDEGDIGAVRMTADRKLLARVVGATDANRLDVDASGHAQVDIAAASVAVPVTAVLDDWDETARCKVNPIAGQAGVAGGSGTVGATTQRVVLATDVALPAGTNAIGVVSTKTALTESAPTSASVGTSSAVAVSSNANRKGLILTNVSSAIISLSFDAAAVLYDGITLPPWGVFVMDEYSFSTGEVRAIASAASSDLAVQEFTT